MRSIAFVAIQFARLDLTPMLFAEIRRRRSKLSLELSRKMALVIEARHLPNFLDGEKSAFKQSTSYPKPQFGDKSRRSASRLRLEQPVKMRRR